MDRRAVRLAPFIGVLLAGLVIPAASAADASGTVKLDPATAQVESGGTVAIKVISNASVPISGLSASITFDKGILQVATITRAPGWASAPLFLAADGKAIATANQKGVLQNVAASFFPPTSVPSGNQDFITVEFRAIACGTVTLTVPTGKVDSTMLDGREASYGTTLQLKTTGATVTVCPGGGGGGGAVASPGASGSLTPGASAAPASSDSFDPNAAPSAPSPDETVSGENVAPSSAPTGTPDGGVTRVGPTTGDGGIGSLVSAEQSGWLTFATAALTVAAAGLAALILMLTIVAIVATVAGGVVLFSVWRRHEAGRAAAANVAAATAETERAPDLEPAREPGEVPVPTEAGAPLLRPSSDRPIQATNA